MTKININWITGTRLIERWGLNRRELYIIITELGLPVYNSDLKREDNGIIYREIPNENCKRDSFGESKSFIEKNNLYDFKQLLENRIYPGLHNLTEERILDNLLFKIEDIRQFENVHMESLNLKSQDLSGKESQELGRLRIEKKKWDDSIVAAVHIGIFCEKLGHPIKRAELEIEILKISDLPYTTIDKIWRAIPDKYRKSAGRPKNQ